MLLAIPLSVWRKDAFYDVVIILFKKNINIPPFSLVKNYSTPQSGLPRTVEALIGMRSFDHVLETQSSHRRSDSPPHNTLPKIVNAYHLGYDGETADNIPDLKQEITKTQSRPFFPHRS